MSFILNTAPAMENAIHIGTEVQVQPNDNCAKTSVGQSRRKGILRFFRRHHKKQEPTYAPKPPWLSPYAEFVQASQGNAQRLLDTRIGAHR